MSWKVLVSNVRAYRRITMFYHGLSRIFLTIDILRIIADSAKIENMIVPEVVQSGNLSGAILDCIYTGASNHFTVQWLFNSGESPVYEWTPRTEPQVRGVLNGRLDLSYRASALPTEERRALRVVFLDPDLSGDYTCRIFDQTTEVRQTRSMLVYSPEKEIAMEFYRRSLEIYIKCTARGLYPQPEIILEHNGVIFPRQQLRMWRSEGLLYDAENTALLSVSPASPHGPEHITCRIQIPLAGYTAIKKELLYVVLKAERRGVQHHNESWKSEHILGRAAIFS